MLSDVSPQLQQIERLALAQGDDDPFTTAVRGASLPMLITGGEETGWGIIYANAAFLDLTGYRLDEIRGRNPRLLQGPDTDPAVVRTMREALGEGREVGVEMLNYRRDGSAFWNAMFFSPVRNAHGRIVYWFSSLLDVTPRKEAEQALVRAHGDLETAVQERTESLRTTAEQKTVLLHEVEHRVKNNLQLIASLIQYQARRTPDPEVRAALREVQDRIAALSTVHRRMFQTEDAGRFDVSRFLRDLVDDLVGRTHREDIAVVFETEPLEAGAAKAAPLALIVNEILAGAIRNFPPGRAGRLTVSLRSDPADRFTIGLSHDAPGPADRLQHALAGPTSIVEILRRQLGAAIEWRDNHPGLAAFITLPKEPA